MADAASNVIDLPARAQRRPKPILDAPVWNLTHAWDVGSVRAALSSLEGGNFQAAAALCDAMDLDDRISGVLDTRVRALLGLDQEWGDPDEESASEDTTVQAFRDAFPQIFPKAQLAELLRWGIRIGVGLGELVWFDRDGKYTPTPRLKVWHPQFLTWRWDTRSFWVTTATAGNVEVTPGRHALGALHAARRAARLDARSRPPAEPALPDPPVREPRQRPLLGSVRNAGQASDRADGCAQEDKDRALLEVAQLASESTISTPQEDGGPGTAVAQVRFQVPRADRRGAKGIRRHRSSTRTRTSPSSSSVRTSPRKRARAAPTARTRRARSTTGYAATCSSSTR
jgi:hypothetical protein